MSDIKGISDAVFRAPINNISISIRGEGPLQCHLSLPNIRTLAGLLATQTDMTVTELEVSDINTNRPALGNPVVARACKAFKLLKVVDGMKLKYRGSEPAY